MSNVLAKDSSGIINLNLDKNFLKDIKKNIINIDLIDDDDNNNKH